MNETIIYPVILVIVGVLVGTMIVIFINRAFSKIIQILQLYPESKSILKISLKFISWFVGIIVFLFFLRLALKRIGLEFTTGIIEEIIKMSPKYILAVVIVLMGFYVSRIIKERSKNYDFEFKNQLMIVIDFIVHMAFILTALYSIGINVVLFVEIYKVVLWVIGAIFALIISMIIGIPLGISIYYKMLKNKPKSRKNL